jgi:hypothetical protein
MALEYKTYSENIRMAAKTARPPLAIRALATAVGCSYEHMRNIYMGKTAKRPKKLTVGADTNAALCEILNLPADEMWQLAEREKYAHKLGWGPLRLPDPLGQELADLWGDMSEEQKGLLVQMANNLTTQHANVR